MQLSLTKIGNVNVLQLPQSLLEQCRISDSVEVEILGDSIVMKPYPAKTRQGWEEAFQQMHNNGDDKLLIEDSLEVHSFAWEW
ncbi:MAG: AbrB/MazE/SpoVT family DNA-binding domain-containing protein [Ignavibacteriae bacterium]|nr:AbrB/MazE/SpoVT family DNA-binding domain-containing protein [Ignavibacteriota bacterium]